MNKLRDIRHEDAEMIWHWRNLPEVADYMYSDHYITREEHEAWFEKIAQSAISKYWVIVSDEQDVGLVNIYGIDRKNQNCYWAFYLASPLVRGKGVGSFVEFSIL